MFGFRKGMSIEDVAFKLTVCQNLWIEKCMLLCFGINHEILLTKLHFIGIQGTMLNWFRSYLTDRKQKILFQSSNSIQCTYLNWG
jgi:hypothetical protein